MISHNTDEQLTNDLKDYFGFGKQKQIMGMPFIRSKNLALEEVVRIAFDTETPNNIAVHFFEKLIIYRNLIKGKPVNNEEEPMKIPEHRLLFVLYETELAIWFD